MSTVLFNEYLPDHPDIGQKGIVDVVNAIPDIKGFREIRDINPFTNALASKVLGAFWAQDITGQIYYFAGDNTSLYELTGNTFADISKVGGYNATRWEFIKFGERVIACNRVDPLQYYDMGSSTQFLDLPGSPPRAAHIAIVRDFVVAGNIDDGSIRPSRVQWSGFNNSELWTPSRISQSGYQDLKGRGGDIQRIVPGDVGIIFQEHSIWAMSYEGPPTFFRFDEIEKGRGTPAPHSVIWTGNTIFYLGHDGFYIKEGTNLSQPLGANRVDRALVEDINTEFYSEVIGAIDRKRRLTMWAYCSRASTGVPDKLAIYSWASNKWSKADISCDYVAEWLSPTYNLDQLDAILADIDSESINVDSDIFQGGTLSLGFFNTDHELGLLDGDPLTAQFETGDIGLNGRISRIRRLRPLIDGAGSITLNYGGRDQQEGNVSIANLATPNRIGEFTFRSRKRYHRFRLNVSGGFRYAVGLDVEMVDSGNR